MLGKLIGGKFKVTKKLGQGGMGSVYLAENVGIGQRVAIKFLNPSFFGEETVVARFLNEARSYGQLAHPHAVQLHEHGQDDEGNLYISMEYVEGAGPQAPARGREAPVDARTPWTSSCRSATCSPTRTARASSTAT